MTENTIEKTRAPFSMPKKSAVPPAPVVTIEDDPLEYYEVTNIEFPSLPVQCTWDGGGPEVRSFKGHYVQNGKLIRRKLESGKIHLIPRSLADYLNDKSVPDPETTVDVNTGQVISIDPGHRRKRFSCVLKRNYAPPAAEAAKA